VIIWYAEIHSANWAMLKSELKRQKIKAQLKCFRDVRHDMLKDSGARPDLIVIDLAAIDMPVNMGYDPIDNYHSAVLHLTEKWSSALIAMYSGMNSYAEDCVKELRELTGRQDIIWIDLSKEEGMIGGILKLTKAYL